MRPTSPFYPGEDSRPTLRQLAIAALIQHIWDRASRSSRRGEGNLVHRNWGIPQSRLPTVDRWANTFSAIVLDRWVDECAARNGELVGLSRSSQGEHRAAYVLFTLWAIARFGSGAEQKQIRRRPASLQDIPNPDLALMQKWWDLSLTSITKREVDRQFEEAFHPTFSQILMDRCIARAAIACHSLPDADLSEIADERDLEGWADRLGGLVTTCENLQRQAMSKTYPTIMITGPTTTGKSAVAWDLARLLDGVAIAADPFQICAIPPIELGVGLASNQPPGDIRSRLYRSKHPGNQRPCSETVADWVNEAVNDSKCDGLPTVIEGGSVTAAMALYRRKIPTHVVVFDAEVQNAENLVRARLSADKMTASRMLAEARAVRASGHETSWVVRESLLYPRLIAVLDHKTIQNDIMSGIQNDWQRLVADQQQWFNDLRALDGVVVLPPSRQSAQSIMELIDLGNV